MKKNTIHKKSNRETVQGEAGGKAPASKPRLSDHETLGGTPNLIDPAKASKSAEECIQQFKTGDDGVRMYEAHCYRLNELWKAQNYSSLQEAIEQETLGISYPSFLRLANAGKIYQEITGKDSPTGCIETALRPLTSLSEKELAKVELYLKTKKISLAGKSSAQVRKIILNSFAKGFSKDVKFNEASDEIARIVSDRMAQANLTSSTAINMVATAIAKQIERKLRKSLTPKQSKTDEASNPTKSKNNAKRS